MRRIAIVVAALVLGAGTLPAQLTMGKMEVRPFVGASLPIGAQRDLYKDAPIYGLQVAREQGRFLHVVGSFGWVNGMDKYDVVRDNVDILQYDVGLELGRLMPMSAKWSWRPFLGLGGGGRSYSYRHSTLNDRSCLAGYGSLGTEFQWDTRAFRFEGRDNVFCYRSPLADGKRQTRNDLGVAFGLVYHIR